MKKIITVVLSLVFIIGLTSISVAAEKKQDSRVKKSVRRQITGDATAVDASANTITVKGRRGEATVSVNEKTRIMAGKGKKTLADIKVGEKVEVQYTEADGRGVAKRIKIKAVRSHEKK